MSSFQQEQKVSSNGHFPALMTEILVAPNGSVWEYQEDSTQDMAIDEITDEDLDYIAKNVNDNYISITRMNGWDIFSQIKKKFPKNNTAIAKLLDDVDSSLIIHNIRYETKNVLELLPLYHVVTQRDINVKALLNWYVNSKGYDNRLANAILIAEWWNEDGTKLVQEIIDGQHRLGIAIARAWIATGRNEIAAKEELREHTVQVAVIPVINEQEANRLFERLQVNRIEPKKRERGMNDAYNGEPLAMITAAWMSKQEIVSLTGGRKKIGFVHDTALYSLEMSPALNFIIYSAFIDKRIAENSSSQAQTMEFLEDEITELSKEGYSPEQILEYYDTSFVDTALLLITEAYKEALTYLTKVNNERQARSDLGVGTNQNPKTIKLSKFVVATLICLIQDNPEIKEPGSHHRKAVVETLADILAGEKKLQPSDIGAGESANQRTVLGCTNLVKECHKYIDKNRYPQSVKKQARSGIFFKVAPVDQDLSKIRSAYFQHS